MKPRVENVCKTMLTLRKIEENKNTFFKWELQWKKFNLVIKHFCVPKFGISLHDYCEHAPSVLTRIHIRALYRVYSFWRFTSCTRHTKGGRERVGGCPNINCYGGGWGAEWSEKREMELHTPKRETRLLTEALPCSPPMCDSMLYPWNWSEEARNVNLSPGSSCSSPEYREHSVVTTRTGPRSRSGGSESHRRGRPRADALSNLMMQGSTSPSSIKCTYCSRVFPREKSLQAHLRTHTGIYCLS